MPFSKDIKAKKKHKSRLEELLARQIQYQTR